ncbi:MAG TPA: hypothetical protein VMK12_08605 [Anaeromyxobacteraceae bacterium]|nr:hypothetical protein [Anaeromyxobacteraceae bacterium]
MSPALLALALLGAAGWFLLLARGETPASQLRLVIEAAAAETVIAALIAVALVSVGAFRPAATLALTAAIPLGVLAKLGWMEVHPLPRGPLVSPRDWLLLLVLVLMAPISLPRMEELRMQNDAGVYTNRAIHHLQSGGLRGSIPLRDRLEGELLAIFDRDNMQHAGAYLPGTYLPASDRARFHFQFFPGWPMVMALWAGIFGVAQASAALVFLYGLSVLLFGLLLERLAEGAAPRVVSLTIFASSPLLLFFSKYSTSEMLLLFLFLFALHFLGGQSRWRAVLAAAGVLLFAVSHSSTFLYAPLLLLLVLEVCRSADRRLALFCTIAFAALLVGLPLGQYFSPFYVHDIFRISFSFLPAVDPAAAGFGLVAAFYAVGLVLSFTLLLRGSRPLPGLAGWADRAERRLRGTVFPALVLMTAWTVWRGYQLGWTDHFAEGPIGGAWGQRMEYVGRGWAAVAHLDIVSMVMATSLVGLPAVVALVLRRGRAASASPVPAFLLVATLWTVAVYTFFRVDTPVNYYASRYFLPVLVPATMLLLGSLLGHLRSPRGQLSLLALVGLSFNLYFDRGLYRHPSETGQLSFVEDVARNVGGNRVLFVRAGEPTLRLLAVLLQSLHGISVVRVAHLQGQSESSIIERYAAELGLTDGAVLSTFAPTAGRAFVVLSLAEHPFAQRGVVYPTDDSESLRRYYLYDRTFGSTPAADGVPSRPAPGDRDQVQ